MNPALWNVVHDGVRLAVISAGTKAGAWNIVRALQDLNDLPLDRPLSLEPCDRRAKAKLRMAAARARLTEDFVACLDGGMFITWLAGTGLDPRGCAV
jgi:hypothetical protein